MRGCCIYQSFASLFSKNVNYESTFEEETRENCTKQGKDEKGKSAEVDEDNSSAFPPSCKVMTAGERDTAKVKGSGDWVSDCRGEQHILVAPNGCP